jgi:hypothetical protein
LRDERDEFVGATRGPRGGPVSDRITSTFTGRSFELTGRSFDFDGITASLAGRSFDLDGITASGGALLDGRSVEQDGGSADDVDAQAVALGMHAELLVRDVLAGERAAVDGLAGALLEEVHAGRIGRVLAADDERARVVRIEEGDFAGAIGLVVAPADDECREVRAEGEDAGEESGPVGTVVLPVPGMRKRSYESRGWAVQGRRAKRPLPPASVPKLRPNFIETSAPRGVR